MLTYIVWKVSRVGYQTNSINTVEKALESKVAWIKNGINGNRTNINTQYAMPTLQNRLWNNIELFGGWETV